MFFIKSLKIGLPLATATTASFITASLVTFKKEKLIDNKEEKDKLLEDLEIKLEEFKDKTINYPKQQEQNGEKDTKGKDLGTKDNQISSIKQLEEAFSSVLEVMKRAETSEQSDQVNLKVPEELSSKPIFVSKEISDNEIQQSSSHSAAVNGESQISVATDLLDEKMVIGDANSEDGGLIQPEIIPNLESANESLGEAESLSESTSSKIPAPQILSGNPEEERAFEFIDGNQENAEQENSLVENEKKQLLEEQDETNYGRDKSKNEAIDSSIENKKMSYEQLQKLLALQRRMSTAFNELSDLVKSFD